MQLLAFLSLATAALAQTSSSLTPPKQTVSTPPKGPVPSNTPPKQPVPPNSPPKQPRPSNISNLPPKQPSPSNPPNTPPKSPATPPPGCKPCAGNTPLTRTKWCEHSIDTDYYNVVPCTGVTREIWLELKEIEGSPDGFKRKLQTINGTVPGPTIMGDWGDDFIIHVKNNLPVGVEEGVSVHWHGIRQNYTNQADGVTSVTQCPSAPGESYTYKFRATQYGSSWYHSHFGLQAWNGMFGGMLIRGPAADNYDVDLGNLFVADWDHETANELYVRASSEGAIPALSGLINGTNVFGADGSGSQTGKRFEMSVTPKQKYLLRLVNPSVDTQFKFTIDNHTMTVIASDFVPVTPFKTNTISIGMGQRYDVIIEANQDAVAKDFWIRAIPMIACSLNDNADNIKGVLHYGSSKGVPTTTGFEYVDECQDERRLAPVVKKNVKPADMQVSRNAGVGSNAGGYFTWVLNQTTYLVNWEKPSLLNIFDGDAGSIFTNTSNKVDTPTKGDWFYLLITEANIPVTHPIHLHGHDFFVLGQGTGAYNPATANLTLTNPPRRDVALLPGAGWLMMAWEIDNPGAWLLHCHIGWHTMQGFAMQFLEMENELMATGLQSEEDLMGTCQKWNEYASTHDVVQNKGGPQDSGI